MNGRPGGHRVLVVEDDEEIREGLREVLEDEGYEVVGAEHGRDALDKLGTLDPRPCLILLDLMMPVMDGRSFRKEQLERPEVSDIPVIVVSAVRPKANDADELRAAGYLTKPPDLEDLMRLIRVHCPASGG